MIFRPGLFLLCDSDGNPGNENDAAETQKEQVGIRKRGVRRRRPISYKSERDEAASKTDEHFPSQSHAA